eukprot:scaffold6951_cov26-Phaeocystis_antarctica.AAC.2
MGGSRCALQRSIRLANWILSSADGSSNKSARPLQGTWIPDLGSLKWRKIAWRTTDGVAARAPHLRPAA